MRIAVITSSFPANASDAAAAAGLFVKDFAIALRDLDHEVVVVTPDKSGVEKEAIPGIDVRWFSWLGGSKPLSVMKPYMPMDALAMVSLFRSGARELDRLSAERPFDHVLAMWAVPAGVLAAGLKRRYGIPFTAWCLGSDIWTYGRYPVLRRVVRSVLLKCDHLYADGLDLCDAAKDLSGRECAFLPTSRKLTPPDAIPDRSDEDGPHFLFVARYHPVKGVDVLLEAMARYVAGGHPGTLRLFGGGPLEDEVRARAAQPDLADRVIVEGFADEARYVSELTACDVFLIPSRMESIPVSLSDAAQLGKCMIVSDVGDMGRLVREKNAGIVVPSEDAEALCNAMVRMANDGTGGYAEGVEQLAREFDVAETAGRWVAAVQN